MGETYFEALKRASSFLDAQGKDAAAALYVFLGRKAWSRTDWLLHMHEAIPEKEQQVLTRDLKRLAEDYPPQYLLGYADFYGDEYLVTEDTLIPRPETEELVERVLREHPEKKLRLIDLGTGSGCIALALKGQRPEWEITATDLSPPALAVARQNGERLHREITWQVGDLFAAVRGPFDVIVSNPPYIGASELAAMDASVKKFEPQSALFAAENGLAFYRRIAQAAPHYLAQNGTLYLEIGYLQGGAVKEIFNEYLPQRTIKIIPDMSGNDRIISVGAERKSNA